LTFEQEQGREQASLHDDLVRTECELQLTLCLGGDITQTTVVLTTKYEVDHGRVMHTQEAHSSSQLFQAVAATLAEKIK
jgi:hypothetical protein